MKDYLYYLFDESLSGDDLSAVKERICTTGAKVIDLQPTKKNIGKRLKELKGPKQYAMLIGNNTEAQQAAKDAKVDFCGLLDGTTEESSFKQLPYRQLLSDIKLLPLISQPYPYKHLGWLNRHVRKYSRWVHIKQIRGMSHKAKHNVNEFVCQNCGETFSGNFCPTCGQTHKVKRFDIANITKEFLANAINFEHGLMRSFLELFWRPGYMMRDYLEGHRVDYNKPFKAIFVLATIYLVAARLLDPASFVKKEVVKLEDIPTISQQLSADTLNTDIVPQLYEINKQAREALAIKHEQQKVSTLEMADSIMRLQRITKIISKEDSTLIMRQIMAALSRADSVKLSEALMENVKDRKDIVGMSARFAARNAEVVEKFEEKYYHEGTLLYSMGSLVKEFFNMNKAVAIILMIPMFVFCARRSFRTTLVGMRTNLAEYIVVFTIFGVQLLWVQLISLFYTQSSDFSIGYDFGAISLMLTWDMKQFFNLGWGNAIKRTYVYMFGNSILFSIILTALASIAGSVLMWLMYQIT